MPDFIFPTSTELRAVEQVVLPRLVQDDPVFQEIFPFREVDDYLLVWEQLDNYIGLQQVRGLDGEFQRVIKVGASRYQIEPGVYGEYVDLNETELTRRRQLGTFRGPLDISDMTRFGQDQLLQRRLDRMRFISWTLLTSGTFSVAGPTGAVLHTDTYTTQTFSAGTVWATAATSTPIANLRSVQLLGPAKGTNFGSNAKAYMNRTTANQLLSNTNAADLGGRRLQGLQPANNLAAINTILMGEDLPQIVVYDDGYFNDSGTFTRFLANNKVVVIGARPSGAPVGEYRLVRNINNPGMAPGPYTEVIQQPNPPKKVQVYDGHSGGPVLYYPGSIVVMTV